MKSPLAKAIISGVAFFIAVQILMPSALQKISPASSGVCIVPSPPNQIKSIQMYPKSPARFFPPSLARSLRPEIVTIHINPYYRPEPTRVLFVNFKNRMMEVNHDFVKHSRGIFDTPFTEESIANVLKTFSAPRSDQKEAVNSHEIYSAILAVCATDIRDESIPELAKLSHYSISFIHPYNFSSSGPLFSLMLAFYVGMSIYRSSKKKETQQGEAGKASPATS